MRGGVDFLVTLLCPLTTQPNTDSRPLRDHAPDANEHLLLCVDLNKGVLMSGSFVESAGREAVDVNRVMYCLRIGNLKSIHVCKAMRSLLSVSWGSSSLGYPYPVPFRQCYYVRCTYDDHRTTPQLYCVAVQLWGCAVCPFSSHF